MFIVDEVLLSNLTPASSLAVEDPHNSRKLIQIPDF
jgi:hypothetical protein